jgi:hypothetical protein
VAAGLIEQVIARQAAQAAPVIEPVGPFPVSASAG